MIIPLEVTFRRMDVSPALRASIEKHAGHLERFADRIHSCHVTVEAVDHRHHKGNLYNVHIHLTLPGGTLDAGHTRPGDHSHEDPYVAVRDAFDAMRRQLEDFLRRRRGFVKHHETADYGRIQSIDAARGMGVIQGTDGREITFFRNAVVDTAFDKLHAGDRVTFVAVADPEGVRASTVHASG